MLTDVHMKPEADVSVEGRGVAAAASRFSHVDQTCLELEELAVTFCAVINSQMCELNILNT